nr:hypothetical protein [Burkholderia ubonensis]
MKSVVSVPALSATIATSGRLRPSFGADTVSARVSGNMRSACACVDAPDAHAQNCMQANSATIVRVALPLVLSSIARPR